MPFNRDHKSTIPYDMPHPKFNHYTTSTNYKSKRTTTKAANASYELAVNKSNNNTSAITSSQQQNNNSSNNLQQQQWHSSKSISWSTKSAQVAQRIQEASQQRE